MLAGMGEPQYRTGQLYAWVHERGVADFAAMTDLPVALRQHLAGVAQITELRQVERRVSQLDRAVKFLFELPGSELVEAVLISEGDRRTACLSSQVGCPLDCQFCATGKMGFIGNLTAAQIVDQLQQVAAFSLDRGERVTNVVMMGMAHAKGFELPHCPINVCSPATNIRLISYLEVRAAGCICSYHACKHAKRAGQA